MAPTNRDEREVQKERDIVACLAEVGSVQMRLVTYELAKLGGGWLRPEASRDSWLNTQHFFGCRNRTKSVVQYFSKFNKTRTKFDIMKNN